MVMVHLESGADRTGLHSRKCDVTIEDSPEGSFLIKTMCTGSHMDRIVAESAIFAASPVMVKTFLRAAKCLNVTAASVQNIFVKVADWPITNFDFSKIQETPFGQLQYLQLLCAIPTKTLPECPVHMHTVLVWI